jgi:ubiquinol-cytochrome c reductase cytochrome c subunit
MNRTLIALSFLSLAATGAIAAEQSAAPSGNAARGKTVYEQVGCYQCHGLAAQGALATGPRLSRTQLPYASFVKLVRHPLRQMPPYEAAALADQEVADIYAYLLSIPAPRDAKSIELLKAER